MSFGFSTGDFIAALELVATIIDALRESGGSGSEYREIVRQLYSLETALITVKRLEVDPEQNAELISLRQAAAQCQQTIDNFWKKVQKYQPHLRAGGSSSKLKDGWMKIQWALCKKEDVARFKADLVGHTESIQLLLTAMQMASASIHDKRQDKRAQSIAGNVQMMYFGYMDRLSNIAGSLRSGIEQGKKLLEMATKVMEINIKVFQVVLDIQRIITTIPGQIDRQKPIYLIDALGRGYPFHLEFVRSPEALISVLKDNFKKVGHAAKMIERGDFVIQDSTTKKDVNFRMEWDLCFSPGQRVEMSMVFKRPTGPTNNCPTCKADCGKSTEEDIECLNCGLNFRRVLDLDDASDDTDNLDLTDGELNSVNSADILGPSLPQNHLKRKRGGNQEEIDEVSLFRRVRIYNIHSLDGQSRVAITSNTSQNNVYQWVERGRVVHLMDIGDRIISKIKEHSDTTEDIPQVLWEISVQIQIIAESCQTLEKDRIEGSSVELFKVVDECNVTLLSLDKLCYDIFPSPQDSDMVRARKALLSLRAFNEFSHYQYMLEQYETALIQLMIPRSVT